MIIWKGLGILVPVVALGVLAITQLVFDSEYGANFYKDHAWPKLLGCFLAALVIWPMGMWLNRDKDFTPDPRDPLKSPGMTNGHTLFFIPIQYWSLLIAAFGVAMYFE